MTPNLPAALCFSCGHIIPWDQHAELRAAVSCPRCEAPNAFGPGSTVEGFKGYTVEQAETLSRVVGRDERG